MSSTPQAGQVFRAKARHGHRLVRIQQVRRRGDEVPYAIAREILPSGEPARGTLRGIPRDLPIHITLGFHRGHPIMPSAYELVAEV